MQESLVSAPSVPPGLTTGRAPFVEEARSRGELYIEQKYELLLGRESRSLAASFRPNPPAVGTVRQPTFPGRSRPASPSLRPYSQAGGGERAASAPDRLSGEGGQRLRAFVPVLRLPAAREFPTTITIRPADKMDYLPEPDIFHDVAGHVPMHTNRAFADVLVRFGDCAHTAVGDVERDTR